MNSNDPANTNYIYLLRKCGRAKNPCKICFQAVTKRNGVQCLGACKKWAHYICLGYTPGKIHDIKTGLLTIVCPCPDCSSQPKEILKDPPVNCVDQHCPANNLLKCDSPECPKNNLDLSFSSTFPCECVNPTVTITRSNAINNCEPKDSQPKDSPPKDSPPKVCPPKDSPPKVCPPKDSPPKVCPPKDGPPEKCPPKKCSPKDCPPKVCLVYPPPIMVSKETNVLKSKSCSCSLAETDVDCEPEEFKRVECKSKPGNKSESRNHMNDTSKSQSNMNCKPSSCKKELESKPASSKPVKCKSRSRPIAFQKLPQLCCGSSSSDSRLYTESHNDPPTSMINALENMCLTVTNLSEQIKLILCKLGK